MSNQVTMSYGGSGLSPVPFMSIAKQFNFTQDATPIGAELNITLQGTLTPLPDGETGYVNVDNLQDDLRHIFKDQGQEFLVLCDSTVILSGYPQVTNINFNPSNDNWVMTTPYTINLTMNEDDTDEDSALHSQYISAANEDWQIEFLTDKHLYNWTIDGSTDDSTSYALRLSHTVSAVGKRNYDINGLQMEAWQQASGWVIPRLGESTTPFSGAMALPVDELGFYDHVRTQQYSETAGSYGVTESWLVLNTGIAGLTSPALEDFNINIQESQETGMTTVNIDGTIQGLDTKVYTQPDGYDVTTTKYASAETYWAGVQSKLYGRVNKVASPLATRTINIDPLSLSVGHNPAGGTITYSYVYDDRPCNYIDGARSENITISDTHPTDVFAELVVLGRSRGPIMQEISTVTKFRRQVTIDAVMEPPTGCTNDYWSTAVAAAPTGDVSSLLCSVETDLTSTYDQVFKDGDTSSWNPKTGRYSRSVSWSATNCTGPAPNTSFC